MRALYESLALKYRAVAEQIAGVSGKPSSVIHIIGGGSKNVFLNQLAANACGMKVVAGPEEATAVGNAMVQAMGLGVIAKLSEAKSMIRAAFPIRELAPRDRETWEKAYARFRTIVK